MAPAGTCTTFTTGKPDIGLPPWLWLVETNTGSLDVLGCAWMCLDCVQGFAADKSGH